MLIIKLIYKILSFFQSHATHQGLAFGICTGMFLGLSPINTLHFWLFLILLFLLKLNLATTLFSWGSFELIGYLGKNAFFVIGDYLLNRRPLIEFWNFLYELPLFPYSNFYVPQVLGKFFCSLTAVIPLYIMSIKLITVLDPIIYHWWRTTKLYTFYRGYKPYA